MAERIEQYLDTVGAHVRWKRVRPALTQELRTHLEEQAEAYRAEGLPAAQAEAEAVRQMGDAEQIGLALDAVHRPKRQTAILSLAGICILLGAIFRILSQDSPKLFTLAALVLTAGLLLGGYYFDHRRLARYAWQIYGVVLALGAVCLSRSFHLANGIGIELGISMGIENEYVVLLFPLAYALAVYALRGKRGGFVLALYAGVPFIAFLHLSDMAPIYQVSFFSRLMLRVGLTAVLLIAIRAGFFRVKAGWACAAVLALLALGVYLDVRSSASRLASYFSPEAMQLWRSLAQKQPFADQLLRPGLQARPLVPQGKLVLGIAFKIRHKSSGKQVACGDFRHLGQLSPLPVAACVRRPDPGPGGKAQPEKGQKGNQNRSRFLHSGTSETEIQEGIVGTVHQIGRTQQQKGQQEQRLGQGPEFFRQLPGHGFRQGGGPQDAHGKEDQIAAEMIKGLRRDSRQAGQAQKPRKIRFDPGKPVGIEHHEAQHHQKQRQAVAEPIWPFGKTRQPLFRHQE